MSAVEIAGTAVPSTDRAMSDRPDLAALLGNPRLAAEVPLAEVPALLDAVTVQKARLETLTSILAARLAIGRNGQTKTEPPYTLQEAARLLLKSPAWLRRQAKAGTVPCAKKVGKSWVFPRADFHRFCDRRHVG